MNCYECDATETPIVSEGGDTIGGECPRCRSSWCRAVCRFCKRAYRFKLPGKPTAPGLKRLRPSARDDCGKYCPAKPKPETLQPADLGGPGKVRP